MFEQLAKKAKLEKAKALFIDALNKDNKWQQDAREDFEFRDGKQWSDAETDIMEEELRPILTFNLSKSSVDLVMGINEDNRIIHKAAPTDPTDGFLCEVLNDLDSFESELHDFVAEEDGALESGSICGRGFVGIDFKPDPDRFGDIIMSEINIPVHEVHFDPASRKSDMSDASYFVWDRWMTKEDFKIRFPKYGPKRLDEFIEHEGHFSASSDPISEDGIPVSDAPGVDFERQMDTDIHFYDQSHNMIRVVHMEYYEFYKRYYIYNPEQNDWVEGDKPTPEQEVAFLETFGEPISVETMFDKRVRWLQFIGNEILYDDISPLPYKGFSVCVTFAYRDVSQRSHNDFGLIRLIKDPQREVNKRWSQALNMLNQQVQPGVFAETEAFVDEDQAKQSMKVAGDITWINPGAISGGKIQERNVPTFPAAPMQMEQFSQDIMKKITGINPDLMGEDSGRKEPGVVVRMRQQQGLTLLKPLFRNFNFMKKELFKRRISIIMKYMPDQQIKAILGQNERYQIDENGVITDMASRQQDPETGEEFFTRQANIRDVRNVMYNIKPEQAPGNLSKRMGELAVMLEMQERLPAPPEAIISKLDISESEKQQWIKYVNDQQQAASQEQEEMKQIQVGFEDRKIKVDEQSNVMDFLVALSKIEHMSEKDEKNMVTNFAQLQETDKNNVLQFASQIISAASQQDQAEQQMAIDAAEAKMELSQDMAKHVQDMRFIEEKNAILLKTQRDKAEQDMKVAREKGEQDILFAKKKAKEGGTTDGKRKPTTPKKN